MWWYRCFPLLLTGACVFFLTGAFRWPKASADKVVTPTPPEVLRAWDAPVEGRATTLLAQALARLQQPDSAWLRTGVWLRLHLPEAGFRGEGTFVRAPGRRYRLEVRTQPDECTTAGPGGYLLILSDGRDHWQATRVGAGGYSEVRRLRLNELPGRAAPSWMMRGPPSLLESLQANLVWVHSETRPGEEVLTGVWSKPLRAVLAPKGRAWPGALPRVYRVVLRGERRWPGRVEAWGPAVDNGADQLLAEMEFRDPAFGQELAEAECSRLFGFDPGAVAVDDDTASVRAALLGR